MKKTQEILGLPIISISDGNEVGKVKSIIVNAEKGAVDYIVVDSGTDLLTTKVIPTEYVLGIGEYALTIESAEVIVNITEVSAAVALLQKNIQVKSTRVMTKKGRLIGETGDYYVDEDGGCYISALEFSYANSNGNIVLIPRKGVITFGKNLIVVTDNVESMLLEDISLLLPESTFPEGEKKSPLSGSEGAPAYMAGQAGEVQEAGNIQDDINLADAVESLTGDLTVETEYSDTVTDNNTADAGEKENNSLDAGIDKQADDQTAVLTENGPAEEGNAAYLFQQRQKQYLNGRIATKTIVDNAGAIIVSEGTVINDEIIDTAKNCGKLIELIMNNKA